ncbi:MAG: hypothetical protein IJ313_07075 [Clostridia bacterium]|nr:hypothetical protein [Clostridia bacterium]
MKSKAYSFGKFCALSPVPFLILSVFCCWTFIAFSSMLLEAMGYSTIPDWILNISGLPLLINPMLSICGVIYGIIKRHEPRAKLGIILSLLGLAQNLILFYGASYLGSRF